MKATNVKSAIDDLLKRQMQFQSHELAQKLGISRQAAHHHLKKAVQSGDLVLEGAGRGAFYKRGRPLSAIEPDRPVWSSRYNTAGLEEHRVWEDLVEHGSPLAKLHDEAERIFHFALTELVNNAIDHSDSSHVDIRLWREEAGLNLEVADQGIGIFENLRRYFHLSSHLEAAQELSKGKATTQRERHTGEGLFFASRVADYFEIQSDKLRYIVDGSRDDWSIAELDSPMRGTNVLFRANPLHVRKTLRQVFDEYTNPEKLGFDRTHIRVHLFGTGLNFVSRSEAKRLLARLEEFEHVTLDFQGVAGVGQGFADEVFRVWANAHPGVELIAENMNDAVAFMVGRAKRRS